MAAPIRLQKFLSQAGVASRRAAEDLIRSGRVRVDGETVTELGVRVDPDAAAVEVDGRPIRPAASAWIALHKPRGYVSTRRDPQGRPTIYDLLPAELHGLFYIGRLDFDSEGLILLTNDGDTANRLLHPRYGVRRVYEVITDGVVTTDHLARLRAGIRLEDGPARAERAEKTRAPAGRTSVRLTLREGRKREVRRMFEALDLPVLRLIRRGYGPLRLGSLQPGQWRHLTPAERSALGKAGGPGD